MFFKEFSLSKRNNRKTLKTTLYMKYHARGRMDKYSDFIGCDQLAPIKRRVHAKVKIGV
jgi:hypothetical protein